MHRLLGILIFFSHFTYVAVCLGSGSSWLTTHLFGVRTVEVILLMLDAGFIYFSLVVGLSVFFCYDFILGLLSLLFVKHYFRM